MLEINETIQLYGFLGEINSYGLIGLSIIMSLLISFSVFLVLKEQNITLKAKAVYASFSALLFIFALVLMKINADSQLRVLHKANRLKSHLINNNWTHMGFKRAFKNLGSDFDSTALETIINTYPTEFIEINNLTDEKRGVKLIDNNAVARIVEQQQLFAPYLKAQVIDYMKSNNRKILSKNEISQLDTRFDRAQIDITLAMFPTDLTPINLDSNIQKWVKLAKPINNTYSNTITNSQ